MTLHTLTADDLRAAATQVDHTNAGTAEYDTLADKLRAAADALDTAHAGSRARCPVCTTPLDPDTWSAEGFEPACRHGIAHTERCTDCHEDAAEAAALAETEGTNR